MNGEFVAAMEDVLELYAEPDDPKRPRVNFDECSVELHKDARPPEPAGPGRPARVDYEYERNGTANLFVVVDPTAGRRHVTVTERRTKADFARQMKALCDDLYPDADRVRVVLDNLNTHTPGALYETFEPAEARRLAAKLEFHYTPKHASWLNMAELELSVLARQCLNRRIPDAAALMAEVAAWQAARNRDRVKIEWCFKIADARKKLRRVYPQQTPAAVH
ncbi:MAG TPA: IS630 family transposase [Gemmataceae bacterium]|nr:IS630 family transposase [Gemmataceae bacterium]